MNRDALLNRLFAAARLAPPDERVPYAFEKRVMARLAKPTLPDRWSLWGAVLWRSVPACAAVLFAAGLWSAVDHRRADDMGADIDAVVLAVADEVTDVETP